MDSGIDLMSENSTVDGSFLTDTWEYMRVRRRVEGERQRRAARDRITVEDWKITGKREVRERKGVEGWRDGQKKTEGEMISVEVELHNLKLEDLKNIEKKREEKTKETALKGINI